MQNNWIASIVFSGTVTIDAITQDSYGNIYFTSNENVFRFDKDDKSLFLLIHEPRAEFTGITYLDNVLYIGAGEGAKILAYSMDTKTLSTLSGSEPGYKDGTFEESLFGYIWALDTHENDIYISEENRIRKMNLTNKTVCTIAGCSKGGHKDGLVSESILQSPDGVAISRDGTVYIADTANRCIRAVKDGVVSTLVGNPAERIYGDGPFHEAGFRATFGIHMNSTGENLFVGEANCLRVVDLKKRLVTSFCHPKIDNYIHSYMNSEGTLFFAAEKILFKLESSWKYLRFLWIGHLKEARLQCYLATLPRDIIKEISQHVVNDE